METAKAHANGGDQGDDWDRTGAQNSCVAKEERRTAPRASRAEQTLPRNLEAPEGAEARKTSHQDQGECRDGKASKKTRSKHFNWSSIAKQENPETVLTSFFQDLYSMLADQLDLAQAERTSLDGTVGKLESGLCRWNIDFNEEVEECAEQPGPDHSGRLEGIAS